MPRTAAQTAQTPVEATLFDQARYHRRQAERLAAEAVQTAGASARALLAARRTNLASVAIIIVLALVTLALAAAVLVDG